MFFLEVVCLQLTLLVAFNPCCTLYFNRFITVCYEFMYEPDVTCKKSVFNWISRDKVQLKTNRRRVKFGSSPTQVEGILGYFFCFFSDASHFNPATKLESSSSKGNFCRQSAGYRPKGVKNLASPFIRRNPGQKSLPTCSTHKTPGEGGLRIHWSRSRTAEGQQLQRSSTEPRGGEKKRALRPDEDCTNCFRSFKMQS